MAFSVRTIPGEDGWTIEMTGEADTSVVPELDIAFRQARADEETLVVDISEVTFIDSRVMSVLEGWSRQLREARRRMPLVCEREEIMRLFRIIGLDRQFEFYPNRASAIEGV